jgi:hypothetical protein
MAMYPMYPEQLPETVDARARDIAAAFQRDRFATKRELNALSQLAAEASRIFPPDFASIDPAQCEIRVRGLTVYKYDHTKKTSISVVFRPRRYSQDGVNISFVISIYVINNNYSIISLNPRTCAHRAHKSLHTVPFSPANLLTETSGQ